MKSCEKNNKNCSSEHKCQKHCYEDCSTCTIRIDRTLPCGHMKKNVPCGLKETDIKCNFPCNLLLNCGHDCQAKCSDPCKPCEINVR